MPSTHDAFSHLYAKAHVFLLCGSSSHLSAFRTCPLIFQNPIKYSVDFLVPYNLFLLLCTDVHLPYPFTIMFFILFFYFYKLLSFWTETELFKDRGLIYHFKSLHYLFLNLHSYSRSLLHAFRRKKKKAGSGSRMV